MRIFHKVTYTANLVKSYYGMLLFTTNKWSIKETEEMCVKGSS